jgi:hypothetical protein
VARLSLSSAAGGAADAPGAALVVLGGCSEGGAGERAGVGGVWIADLAAGHWRRVAGPEEGVGAALAVKHALVPWGAGRVLSVGGGGGCFSFGSRVNALATEWAIVPAADVAESGA